MLPTQSIDRFINCCLFKLFRNTGYTQLMQKMALAYRVLLAALDVTYFLRADVDSVIPLHLILPLLPLAASGQAVQRVSTASPMGCGPVSAARWRSDASLGTLACQTECSVDKGCAYFTVDTSTGSCATFGPGCGSLITAAASSNVEGDVQRQRSEMPRYDVYEYRLRSSSVQQASSSLDYGAAVRPFVLGTILCENKVLYNDTHNPQWNNRRYREDLGLRTYPPYPEASGYAMSASLAAFLAGVGQSNSALAPLAWKAWAIEDTAVGTALAGLDVDLLQLPVEVRERMRVIRAPRGP